MQRDEDEGFNILPLVPHAGGRFHKSLIFLEQSRALAAIDALRYLTVFDDFPQKSLASESRGRGFESRRSAISL